MKKNYLFGLCAAAMLLTTSCQQEGFFAELWGEKEQTVTLNVAIPELGAETRAYGTGVNATNLQYAVYSLDAQDNLNERIEFVDDKVMTGTNPVATTLVLKLVPGTKYAIVLWADAYGKDNTDSPFTITLNESGTTTMVIDHTKVKANDDMPDAFFGSYVIEAKANSGYEITEYGKTTALVGNTLKLKRPFAQLNIAALNSDLELAQKSAFDIVQTSVKIQNVRNTLNLRTGDVSGNAVETTYATNAIPTNWDKTTYTDYTLLAMNYVLMPADKETVQVIFNYYGATAGQEGEKSYSNVPLRRNWRTNIYGELFTNPVNITVELAPNFADQTDEDEDNGPSDGDTDNNDMYDVDATVTDNTTTNP